MGQKNSTEAAKACLKAKVPKSSEYKDDFTKLEIVSLVFSIIVTIIVFILYLEVLIRFINRRSAAKRALERNRPAIQLFLYPVFCITSVVAVAVPRTSHINDLVAALYLGLCVFKFYRQAVWYYGGPDEMIAQLKDKIVELRGPPCCCCCFCLPGIIIDKTALSICQFFVVQVAAIRPFCAFLISILTVDGVLNMYKSNTAMIIIQVIQVLSTILAMYGVLLLFRMSKRPLHHQNLAGKFIVLAFVLLFANIQWIFIDIFAATKLLGCTQNLIPFAVGEHIHHHLLVAEMFVLMVISRKIYVDQNRKRAYDLGEKQGTGRPTKAAPGGPNGSQQQQPQQQQPQPQGVDNQGQEMAI